MASSNYRNVSSVIIKKLYPVVEKKLQTRSSQFTAMIADFMNRNHKQLFDIAPYYNILYSDSDKQALFKAIDLGEHEVIEILKECFFWDIPYTPGCAKEPYVEVLMMAIRYFLKNKKKIEAEKTAIYLCFTGKFYASNYASKGCFTTAPPGKYKPVMDFVINYMLTEKYDLRSQGSVFGAIRKMCVTFIDSYEEEICGDINDDEVGKEIQQLRTREKNFIYNIAQLYFKAYENKDYLNSTSENMDLDLGDFRLTENDSAKAARLTQNSLYYMLNSSVSMTICNHCCDTNVRATEIRDIMTAIFSEKEYVGDLTRVISIIIGDFIKNNPRIRVGSADFIIYSLKAKPNVKDKYLIELKKLILGFLDEKSPNFRRRKSRKATADSYYKAVLRYIVLAISKATEKG